MKLIFNIAWTHVSSRVRQTLVGMAGVSMGVGFTIMMAGLMQGSQIDFLRQLVDTMPHITIEDERRSVPTQPAEQEYGAVQMSDIANVGKRPGIKYPESVMSSLRSWIPGDVAPSVRTTAIINHGGARIGITLTGIDPRRELQVSKLASQMREGKLDDLSRASNGVIIGEALAEKLGLKTGNTVLLVGGQGVQLNSTVTGLFRSGLKRVDESQIYSLMGPAQVMMGQSGVVNQLRLRLSDPMMAQKVAAQVEAQTGYKSVSWQEANADLLSTFSVRDFIVLTVMGAMLLTSSFATYNIISTITHEKRAGHRDHEVARHARICGAMDIHHRSRHDRRGRHPVRVGPRLPALLRLVQDHDLQSADGHDRSAADLLLADALCDRRRHIPALLRRCGLFPGAQGDAGASG